MKEIELIDKFCNFLRSKGYDYKREVRKGSYHNEGYIDIVIKNNGLLIGIEAKLNAFSTVIGQASSNRLLFPFSYILVPKISKKMKEKCNSFGIGVIIPSSESFSSFTILTKPIYPYWCMSKSRYFKILRNWVQNRIGRPIDKLSHEIPLDYNQKHLDELNPSYSWTYETYDPYKINWKELGFSKYPVKPVLYNPKKERKKKTS